MPQLENIEAIEKRLWNAADTLRANSNYASNEYFLPVMGLIFLRHAYSRFLAVKDEIEAEVVSVSQEDKRIGLSIRKLNESTERDIHRSYVDNKEQATSSLGDLLKEKMMNMPPQASHQGQESEPKETAETEPDAEAEAAYPSSEDSPSDGPDST